MTQRTEYMDSMLRDMRNKDVNQFIAQAFGRNMAENDPETLPQSEEELQLHMQLDYKQSIEIAEEQALNTLFNNNKYENTRKRLYYDLAVIGIGCIKNTFDTARGITIEYVDPAHLVWSHTDSPYFDDIYYIGEVKTLPINELKKQFPDLTEEDLKEASESGVHMSVSYTHLRAHET